MSDERQLKDMTVADWRERVRNLRFMLTEAERQYEAAQQRALDESPLVQAVLETARRPVR